MKGYVARKRNRYYAVIYEGLDPVTGRAHRSWHPAGTDREDAEHLAAKLAAERNGRNDDVRSLTFGAYLATQWLPGKQLTVATSTYRGYLARPSFTSSPHWAASACGASDPGVPACRGWSSAVPGALGRRHDRGSAQ